MLLQAEGVSAMSVYTSKKRDLRSLFLEYLEAHDAHPPLCKSPKYKTHFPDICDLAACDPETYDPTSHDPKSCDPEGRQKIER